jgi:hypothetical protein
LHPASPARPSVRRRQTYGNGYEAQAEQAASDSNFAKLYKRIGSDARKRIAGVDCPIRALTNIALLLYNSM